MVKRTSKLLALLLSLIMVTVMIPSLAFAEDESAESGSPAAEAAKGEKAESDPSVAVPTEPESGIPLIVVNVDECELYTDEKGDTYGSIQDMNESEDHSVRCKGNVDILVPEGYSYGYGDSVLSPDSVTGKLTLSYIRGRGNSTWTVPKKPYKIKFENAQDLFGMGSSKEWALMAGALEITLMKNRIISWLGEQIGMPFTPQMVPVDLVLRGSSGTELYLGSYTISETVDVEESRVDIKKLKKNTEAETGENNITGGYLISLYNDSQDSDEPRNAVFQTDAGVEYYIRTPEYEGDDSSGLTAGQNKQREYISSYIQNVENLIMESDPIDEETHNKITDLLDLKSAADYWLVQEFTKNGDAYLTGSTYLYKDRDGKLCFGPLWDFDGSMGSQNDDGDDEEDVTGFNNSWFCWIAELRAKDPLFVELIKERWELMDEKLGKLTADNGVIDQFRAEVAASQVKNGLLWPDDACVAEDAEAYNKAIEKQKSWIDRRRAWFNENIDSIHKSTIKVTYILDGDVVKTEKVNYNSSVLDPPEAPAKEGYIFIGWYCEKEQQYAGDFSILEDTEFIAKFISETDEVLPTEMYLQRYEDWADLQGSMYQWVSDVRFMPENTTIKEVTWSSSDENVAEVFDGGYVTLHSTGDVVITATHHSGLSASYKLHVYDSEETEVQKLTGVKFSKDKLTLNKGDVVQTEWTVVPHGCPVQDAMIDFESSNESVAEIDQFGVVTAVSPGTAVVTVTAEAAPESTDDDVIRFTGTCEVTVKDPAAPVYDLKGTKIRSLKGSSKAITVKWKKQTARIAELGNQHITGYQIQLATDKKFTKNRRTVTVRGYKNTSKKIKKLKGRTRYYVRVRTYKTWYGTRHYSAWSGIRSVKTKR